MKQQTTKHQCKCNDCGLEYFLEDSVYCIHQSTLGIGSHECPQCHNCICHGQTRDQIEVRFQFKKDEGKFVKSPIGCDWDFQCTTIKEIPSAIHDEKNNHD